MYKLMVYQDTSHVEAQPRCHVFEFNTEKAVESAHKFFSKYNGCWCHWVCDSEKTR